MLIRATDNKGKTHTGRNIKNILICEENGCPIAVLKESIIGEMTNYRMLVPGDPDFHKFTKSLGYDVELIKPNL